MPNDRERLPPPRRIAPEPDPTTVTPWFWRRLPVLLLLVIAAVQIALAVRRDLNPWKGGGFGMFSTVDSPSVRHLEVLATGPGFEEPVDPSPLSASTRRRAKFYPSQRHLEDVALRLRPHWPSGTREIRVFVWSLEGDPHLPRLRRVSRGSLTFRVVGAGEGNPGSTGSLR